MKFNFITNSFAFAEFDSFALECGFKKLCSGLPEFMINWLSLEKKKNAQLEHRVFTN